MRMRRAFVILINTFLLLSCARRQGEYRAPSFPIEKEVSVELVGDPLELGLPVDLCQAGEYLFVLAYSPENWLHVYDKRTGAKVGEAVKVGRGPGEGLNLVTMDWNPKEGNLYAFDQSLHKTLVYRLDGTDAAVSFVREIQHPSEAVIRACHQLPGGRFLYEGYLPGEGDKNTRYTLSDGLISIDSYDSCPGVDDDDDRLAFLLGVSKGDPVTGRFVSGTMYGAVLECFDLSEGRIHPVATRLIDRPEMDLSGPGIRGKEGTKYGFYTFCLSEKLIYANYLDSADPKEYRTVATFDWKGREQTKYHLDRDVIRMCPAQESDGTLYGISLGPEQEFVLARFRLD